MPITEILLMRRAGVSPMDILVSATRNAAHVCGLADEVGTIEAGKLADILVVKVDPLENLTALLEVRLVLKSGVVVHSPPVEK